MAPTVVGLQEQYADDVRFIGVAGQDNFDEMQAFVHDFGLTGFDHFADHGSEIWRLFDVSSQPTFVFINDSGQIGRRVGAIPAEEMVAELDALLAS